jgi:hypothetical protein
MKERTIFILIAMMAVVLITSAFGAYQDSDTVKDSGKDSGDNKKNNHKQRADAVSKMTAERSNDASSVVGASGAGMSHKIANSHLDTSVKANGPYVDDGSNTYKGKNRGRDLNESDSDSDSDNGDSDSDSDSDSDHGKDSDNDHGKENDSHSDNDSDFIHKLKYIKKKVSKLFEEIFSKWGNQGSVMAPSGIEEMNPEPGVEGLRVREKLTKNVRNGMRKVKSAFRGRR